MAYFRNTALLLLALSSTVFAQPYPSGAHVNLYFPQVADGGPAGNQWQTSFTFVSTNDTSAFVELTLFSSSGAPLQINLGSGLGSTVSLTVPAHGSRVLRSVVASSTTVVGWAQALSSVPIVGMAAYRNLVNGVPRQEIAAQATLPGLEYISVANRYLGVALANVYSDQSLSMDLYFRTTDGALAAGPTRVTIPPLGHTAFNLIDRMPSIGNLSGVLSIEAVNQPYGDFLAWTLGADSSGTLTTLPPGTVEAPISHYDRIWKVFLTVLNSARSLGLISNAPTFRILTDPVVNAYARNGNEVAVTVGLSELISDSPSELAFAIAHELAHIRQQITGIYSFSANPEFDADSVGTLIALVAGYDPYAAAGALAKLSMATGTAGLAQQFESQLNSDAHKSFNERLSAVFETLVAVCNSSATAQAACQDYKSHFHPHLPPVAPLQYPLPADIRNRPEIQ